MSPSPPSQHTHTNGSNAGGGGERVLWLAIKALAALHESESSSRRPLHVVIYAGAEDAAVGGAAILAKAEQHFGVALQQGSAMTLPVSFAFVRGRPWLEARRYPVFTMLGQSAGSVLFALACLAAFVPDVWLDTTGCAFTYPVAAVLGISRVAAYVHYPTISTDMLSLVREQRPSYNNDAAVAGSGWRSRAKLLCVSVHGAFGGLCLESTSTLTHPPVFVPSHHTPPPGTTTSSRGSTASAAPSSPSPWSTPPGPAATSRPSGAFSPPPSTPSSRPATLPPSRSGDR